LSRPGTVYLVGAGPGDPGLLTVRALDLVRQADIVLHDHLVSPEILAQCGSHTRLVDVGKVGHGPQTDQTAIERQLIAFARRGCRVVRLKGGDPFLFGRGSEEASALRAANVPFEIVPGVSSALAAPAYAGIPLTARGLAASVAIITGHCGGSGATPATIPIADTVVVLMGIANAASIRDQWLAAGRCPDTPAAVIEWGTCAQQRVAVATVATLPDVIARACLQAPAVIVIGETVRLRSVLDWFDSSSLDGRDVAPRRRSEHRQQPPVTVIHSRA
jgi:uroporphyrinogen III methyltransferase / synthase